jgi:hypothetical protein
MTRGKVIEERWNKDGGDIMSNIEVKELKKEDYELWDELVENSPHGTIFHSSDWLTTCSEILNKKLKIFGCFENEELVGGCSLYVYKSKFLKTASSTIEMTPYGGVILAQSPSAFDDEHFDTIQITNSPDFVDVRPFIWNGWDSKIHYAYYFNLENEIEKSISKKVRNIIRKAIKNNVTIKKLSDASIYYELFSMTFERQNRNPPVTKEFLETMIELLNSKNAGEMWIAEVASAEIVIWDNKRAYRWSAALHTNFKDTGATSLLLYEIFRDLKNRGFKEINLMAANTPQLTKFISGFNPKLVPYYGVEKSSIKFKVATNVYKTIGHIIASRSDKSNESAKMDNHNIGVNKGMIRINGLKNRRYNLCKILF